MTPAAREMLEQMAAALPRPQAEVMRAVLKPRLTDRALPLLGDQRRSIEPLLRNTVNATIVRGGEKINVIPSQVEVELDGRLLPGFVPDDIIREVETLVGLDLELEVVQHDAYPAHSDLSQLGLLGNVLRELDPEAIPVPMLQVGVTDGRFFAAIGIQTYGFIPLNLPEGFEFLRLIHAADERVPVDSIRFGAEAIGRVLERYTG